MGDTRLEPLVLSEDERRRLENWVKRRSTAQGLALRARIVLACAQGGSNLAVAARLGVNRGTVTRWRARFLAGRLDGLTDGPRPGVPRTWRMPAAPHNPGLVPLTERGRAPRQPARVPAVLFGDGSAMRAQCSCTDQVVLARQFGPTVEVDHTRR